MHTHWPEVPLCYVDCNHTGGSQPLDRAVVRPWKEELRNAAATDLAAMLINGVEDINTIMTKPGLKNKIIQWVESACDKVKTKEDMFQRVFFLTLWCRTASCRMC